MIIFKIENKKKHIELVKNKTKQIRAKKQLLNWIELRIIILNIKKSCLLVCLLQTTITNRKMWRKTDRYDRKVERKRKRERKRQISWLDWNILPCWWSFKLKKIVIHIFMVRFSAAIITTTTITAMPHLIKYGFTTTRWRQKYDF